MICHLYTFFFKAGARYVSEDCSEVCVCGDGELICTPYGCNQFADCKIQNGVRDCYCQDGFKGAGQTCVRGGCCLCKICNICFYTFKLSKYFELNCILPNVCSNV